MRGMYLVVHGRAPTGNWVEGPHGTGRRNLGHRQAVDAVVGTNINSKGAGRSWKELEGTGRFNCVSNMDA